MARARPVVTADDQPGHDVGSSGAALCSDSHAYGEPPALGQPPAGRMSVRPAATPGSGHVWVSVASLHGGNLALRELVGRKGPDYARTNLRFALLEFWSMRTSDEHVLAREAYWKEVLLSREFGNNRN